MENTIWKQKDHVPHRSPEKRVPGNQQIWAKVWLYQFVGLKQIIDHYRIFENGMILYLFKLESPIN